MLDFASWGADCEISEAVGVVIGRRGLQGLWLGCGQEFGRGEHGERDRERHEGYCGGPPVSFARLAESPAGVHHDDVGGRVGRAIGGVIVLRDPEWGCGTARGLEDPIAPLGRPPRDVPDGPSVASQLGSETAEVLVAGDPRQ